MGNVMAAGFRRVRGWHAPLAWFCASMAALAAVSAVGMGLDARMLVGAPIWAKPLKFSLSFVAYSVTLAWLVAQLPRARRLAWWTGTVIVVASAIEMIIIVGQVLRGRQSHFNITTSLDASLFSIMAVTIAVLYVANLLVAFMLLRSRLADPVTTWAVRLGVIIALGGMAVGFLMVGPTPEQAQALAAGQTTLSGAHSVGVADGGPGLPLVGWSTTGGDLRIGHFVGMHGLQALPLLAMVLTGRRARRLPERARVRLVGVAAGAYAGVTGLTTWQALRGQPLLGPDSTTLAALGVLAALTVIGAAAAVLSSRAAHGAAIT
jgi:hypothetical protein